MIGRLRSRSNARNAVAGGGRVERDGRLRSVPSRSPTPPPYHPSAITLAYDGANASGVTMGPYSCFFRGGQSTDSRITA